MILLRNALTGERKAWRIRRIFHHFSVARAESASGGHFKKGIGELEFGQARQGYLDRALAFVPRVRALCSAMMRIC
jgi:hypothetical protein